MSKITVIKPENSGKFIDLSELWQFRELFWTLAMRDIKVRYKQTVIGVSWALIQPLLTMVVFSFFFGKIAKMPSDGIPYPLFSYTGLILWTFFTTAISAASMSMLSNAHLITKIYFPRLIVPVAATLVSALDYAIAFSLVGVILIFYQRLPSIWILALPIAFLGTWLLAIGMGLFLAALNVLYRDIRYAIPFFIQLLVFVTPVIYPASVAGTYKLIVLMNPMSAFLEAHRAMILGHTAIPWLALGGSLCLSLVIFIVGLWYFRKVERYFSDII